MQWAWRPPSVLPETPTLYPQFWRAPGVKVWQPIIACVLMAVAFLTFTNLSVLVALFAGGIPSEADLDALLEGTLSPEMVFANSLGLALVLPFAFLIVRVTGQRPGYLSSVTGRFRWGFFAKAVGVTAAVFGMYTGLSSLLDGSESADLAVRPYTWWLLVAMMLVTPFQAALEEYLLRGFVLRTVGSWFAGPVTAAVVGGVVNSLIFTALHASGDLWLNLVYFTMGAIASLLVWRTGGLEGAVAIHIVNNMIGMAILPFQDLEGAFDRSAGVGGPEVLLQILVLGISAALILWLARRDAVATTGPVGVAPGPGPVRP